jgi:hypothetical protein
MERYSGEGQAAIGLAQAAAGVLRGDAGRRPGDLLPLRRLPTAEEDEERAKPAPQKEAHARSLEFGA